MASASNPIKFAWCDQKNCITMMPWWQYNVMYCGPDDVSWHESELGGFDHDRAAMLDGYRIFVFASIFLLKGNPAVRRFCVGGSEDFQGIATNRGLDLIKVENMFNPIQKLPEWGTEIPIATITAEDFQKAFGGKVWTSRFPQRKGIN